MRLRLISLVFPILGLGLPAGIAGPAAGQTPARPVVRIATLVDGPWSRNDEVLDLFREEILAVNRRDFEITFPEAKQIEGDWSPASVRTALDRLLADPQVDVILAIGVLASDNACRRGDLPKPVIAPVVIDREAQELPQENGASGVRNLSYLTIPSTLTRDAGMFREIVPFRRLTILLNQYIMDGLPGLAPGIDELLRGMDIEPSLVTVGDSVDEALARIPGDTEAVYLVPLLQLSDADFSRLLDGIQARKLPTFSFFGEMDVRRGVLAGLNPEIFPRLSRRVALNLQRILLGEPAATLPTAFSVGERLMINMATANAIGVYPSWAILTEAEVVGDASRPPERRLDLDAVMREAERVNLDLAASARSVAAGREEVHAARAGLLPQVDLEAVGRIIDEDRAEASLGSQAERAFTGTATLTQVLFADPAWANLGIQGRLQEGRVEGHRELRLDVIQSAADAYLQVLRARTVERIQRDNLALSRTNLELARVRRDIGQSGPSDVLRWESRIATSRRDAILANARRNVAEIALNRILARPLEEAFTVEELAVREPGTLIATYPQLRFFKDRGSFRALRRFWVEEGMGQSPELRQLDAAIAATERQRSAATRAFTLPTLALQGSVSRRFDESGAGSGGSGLTLPGLTLPQADETDWSLGLRLSYPLLSGGGKLAERRRAGQELERLRFQRRAAGDRIEQRIRSAAHLAGASFAGIQQAFDAAASARQNLDLVTDNYSRGTVSIIELLDAQNAFLVADESAANAVYDFLIDHLEVERALGRFETLMDETERNAYTERLEAFMAAEGFPR